MKTLFCYRKVWYRGSTSTGEVGYFLWQLFSYYFFTPSLGGALLLSLLSLLLLLSLLFTAGGTGVYLYGGRGMSPLPPVCDW